MANNNDNFDSKINSGIDDDVLKILVTGFCDWVVTDPPSNIWRCYANPSGRLLIGDDPEIMASTQTLAEDGNASMYKGLLCKELNKITSVMDKNGNTRPVVWDYVVAPTIWRTPLQDCDHYESDQTPFTRLKDLQSYDIVYHVGMGSYSPPWPILLELGAIDNVVMNVDALNLYPDGGSDISQYQPTFEISGEDDKRMTISKTLRNSNAQLQRQTTVGQATAIPPLNLIEPSARAPVKNKITRITGMTTSSRLEHTIVAALARKDNSFVCNQTNWTGLTLMNRAYDSQVVPTTGPVQSYFMHVPWGNAPGQDAPDPSQDHSVHISDDFADLAVAAADVVMNIVDFYGRGLQNKLPKSTKEIQTDMAKYNMYSAK